MTGQELLALRGWARDRLVLELGSWHGEGTKSLAEVASMVVTVDHHMGDDHVGRNNSLPRYLATMDVPCAQQNVVTIVCRFSQVLPLLVQHTYGLVIVDGAHDQASAAHDIRWATRLVDRHGVIAVHDWQSDDVQRAATRILSAPDKLVDRLAAWQRR